MTAVALAWGGVAVLAVRLGAMQWDRRATTAMTRRRLIDAAGRRRRPVRRDPLTVLGGAVMDVRARMRPDSEFETLSRRRLGLAVVLIATIPLAPTLAALGLAVVIVPAVRRERRRRRVSSARVADGLPEVVDLLAVAAAAGLTVPRAVGSIVPRAPPPWSDAFRAAVERSARGSLLVDSLDEVIAQLGDPARPLVAVLRAADRDGAPLVAGLDRLAAEARDIRRRRAEAAARRVPVRLLFPLVACVLPAFGLLTVVPLLAGALEALTL